MRKKFGLGEKWEKSRLEKLVHTSALITSPRMSGKLDPLNSEFQVIYTTIDEKIVH